MTVPSSTTIARWRHVVRVIVRLVAVPLLIYAAFSLVRLVIEVAMALMLGGTFTMNVIVNIGLAPLLIALTGCALIWGDKRLATLIVPVPSKGCPGCGYWIGSREMTTCPECGLNLGER